MKRVFAVTFLVLVILSLLAAAAWSGYCIWDYQQMLEKPGLSGIDFLMCGAFYGIGMALISLFGAICALIQSRLTRSENVQLFDYVVIGIFCLAGSAAFFLLIM